MRRAAWYAPRTAVLSLSTLLLAACEAPNAAQPAFQPEDAPPGTYIEVGTNLLKLNEPDLAFDAFITSMRVDGVTADALTGAGLASTRLGLLTTAKRYFERAIELDPQHIGANNNLGVVLFSLKEYYPARDAFRAAYALSSGRSEIAERNLNRADAVIAEIEEARQQEPVASHRVVRLGTSEFRITPAAETPVEMIGAN